MGRRGKTRAEVRKKRYQLQGLRLESGEYPSAIRTRFIVKNKWTKGLKSRREMWRKKSAVV